MKRPRLAWPHDARVAFWVAPNVLVFEYLPLPNPFRDPWPRTPHPDVRSYAHQDYGNRIGFWRVLEVLDRYRIRCTASINLAVLQRFPEIREAMVQRDWDYMPHGIYNTRYVWGASEEEERAYLEFAIAQISQHTGKQPNGALGPGQLSTTARTSDLLAELGFSYQADWFHDDQPFPIKVRRGKLISMPYASGGSETSDVAFLRLAWEADDFVTAVRRQFDRLYAEGAESGRVMSLPIHPYRIGQPHRIKYLDQILEYVLSHDGVWVATASEIASHYLAHHYEQVSAQLESSGDDVAWTPKIAGQGFA